MYIPASILQVKYEGIFDIVAYRAAKRLILHLRWKQPQLLNSDCRILILACRSALSVSWTPILALLQGELQSLMNRKSSGRTQSHMLKAIVSTRQNRPVFWTLQNDLRLRRIVFHQFSQRFVGMKPADDFGQKGRQIQDFQFDLQLRRNQGISRWYGVRNDHPG